MVHGVCLTEPTGKESEDFSLQPPARLPTNQNPEAREWAHAAHPIRLMGTEEGGKGGAWSWKGKGKRATAKANFGASAPVTL